MDLGDLIFFLGVDVIPNNQCLFLTLKKYTSDLLERIGQNDAKEVTTPKSIVVATTTSELCWIQSLLHELWYSPLSTLIIFYDNVGTTYICANPFLHSKMKHIKFDFHFVRENVTCGKLCVSHVSVFSIFKIQV